MAGHLAQDVWDTSRRTESDGICGATACGERWLFPLALLCRAHARGEGRETVSGNDGCPAPGGLSRTLSPHEQTHCSLERCRDIIVCSSSL